MERVPVLNGYVVQSPVINAGAKRLVLLIHKEEAILAGEEDGRLSLAAREEPIYFVIASNSGTNNE